MLFVVSLKTLRSLKVIAVFSSLGIDIIHINDDFYLSSDNFIHSSEDLANSSKKQT